MIRGKESRLKAVSGSLIVKAIYVIISIRSIMENIGLLLFLQVYGPQANQPVQLSVYYNGNLPLLNLSLSSYCSANVKVT